MLAAIEAGEQDLAFVGDAVTIRVGVNQQVRRHGDNQLVIQHGDAERRGEFLFLNINAALVGLARAGGVFEDDNAVTFFAATRLAAIVHTFGHIHPALRVEVDVGWIVKQW